MRVQSSASSWFQFILMKKLELVLILKQEKRAREKNSIIWAWTAEQFVWRGKFNENSTPTWQDQITLTIINSLLKNSRSFPNFKRDHHRGTAKERKRKKTFLIFHISLFSVYCSWQQSKKINTPWTPSQKEFHRRQLSSQSRHHTMSLTCGPSERSSCHSNLP